VIYLLWYRENPEQTGTLACVCGDYYKAEEMAEQVEFSLRVIGGKEIHDMHISRVPYNKVFTNFSEIESTWMIYLQGAWFLEE